MKEYAKKPENASRTLDSNPKASKQAPISQILQAYKDRIEGKPVQRQSINEEELLQAKATQQDHIKAVIQRYSERNIQRYAPEEDEELIQGKFDIAQRETIDEDELLQRKFESTPTSKQEPIQREEKPNNTGLPDNLKTDIENLSGYSMDDVKVHYNSDKPAQLNALAYAQGTDIHVAPGQERHLPHEAWHVVQQKQGRVQPTMQLQGVNVNDNEGLEREATSFGCINFPSKLTIEERNIVKPYSSLNIVQGIFEEKDINYYKKLYKNAFLNLLQNSKISKVKIDNVYETKKYGDLSDYLDENTLKKYDILVDLIKDLDNEEGNKYEHYSSVLRGDDDSDSLLASIACEIKDISGIGKNILWIESFISFEKGQGLTLLKKLANEKLDINIIALAAYGGSQAYYEKLGFMLTDLFFDEKEKTIYSKENALLKIKEKKSDEEKLTWGIENYIFYPVFIIQRKELIGS